MAFCACSSSDDNYLSEYRDNTSLSIDNVSEVETQYVKVHLCISYDESITDYFRFVILDSIILSPWLNPDRKFKSNVSHSANDSQCSGNISWDGVVTFIVPKGEVIPYEHWLVKVNGRVNQLYAVGDYKIEMYIYDDYEDTFYLRDSCICNDVSGGCEFTLIDYDYGFYCYEYDQTDYYLNIRVKPVSINQ